MKVRVTELDTFRQWLDSEDDPVESLVRRLRREEPPSEAMLAGIAFHAALEQATEGAVEVMAQEGYKFQFDTPMELALPRVREIRAYKQFEGDHGPIVVTGRLDAIEGRTVYDHKTTGRFNPERYLEGYQWRLYLDIFDADRFVWNVFETKEIEPKVYSVFVVHHMSQVRYPGMELDCLHLIHEFEGFAAKYLPERFANDQ